MNIQNYYAIYSRKSKFTGKGESIENQIELCRNQLINKYGHDIKNRILIYQDEGFTGYNTNRPQFQQMMQDVRSKKIKSIIVYRLDRISRNVSDFCILKDELAKYNVDFFSLTENFDTSSPMGKAMLMITSVFAQLERDTIAERIRDNMYELAKTGRWLGGNTPLGYRSKKIENISIEGKKKSLYQLEQINDEVEIIKLLWNKMDELKGLNKLESVLMQQGIKTRNNNDFTRFSLVTIFTNPVYVIADNNIKDFFEKMGTKVYADEKDFDGKHGLIAYNKRNEILGKANIQKDVTEWIIAVGKHEGIIRSDKFIEIWQLLENNKNKRCRVPQQNTSILSGVIKCKCCGSYMRPKLRMTVANNGERNFAYLCELKDKSRKKFCQNENINGIETDKLVIQKIKKLTVPISDFIVRLKDISCGKDKDISRKQNELQNLNITYTKNKIKIESLIDKLAIIDKDLVNDITVQIKSIKNKNDNIEERIKILTEKVKNEVDQKQIDKIATGIIRKYMDSFETLDIISKRNLIKLLISSVETEGKNIYINFIGDSLAVDCP